MTPNQPTSEPRTDIGCNTLSERFYVIIYYGSRQTFAPVRDSDRAECDEYVSLWVCLSVREDIHILSSEPHARSLPIFLHVAYVRGSVLLRHVYDRPHRLSSGRGFFPVENALSAGKGAWECTARVKYPIYDQLVILAMKNYTVD